MNTLITFRYESGRILRRKAYLKFVGSGILGVFAATTTLVVLSHYVEVFVAKLVSILISFAANFSVSHFVVFRPRDGSTKPEIVAAPYHPSASSNRTVPNAN
jgi:putative flippase GtrA